MMKLLAILTVLASLDNTIKNDFWDTTAYTNAVPAVTNLVATSAVDAGKGERAAVTIDEFNSLKPGLVIFIR